MYHFLPWVFTLNRSHLKLLKKSERIKDVDTPQREAQFQRLEYKNSSFLAWYGSGFDKNEFKKL